MELGHRTSGHHLTSTLLTVWQMNLLIFHEKWTPNWNTDDPRVNLQPKHELGLCVISMHGLDRIGYSLKYNEHFLIGSYSKFWLRVQLTNPFILCKFGAVQVQPIIIFHHLFMFGLWFGCQQMDWMEMVSSWSWASFIHCRFIYIQSIWIVHP